MKTPNGKPRIAPTRNPQATEPNAQPIRMQSTITASVEPIRTEPAPARLKFGVGFGSIGAASIAELVTAENRLVEGKTDDFVQSEDGSARPRPRVGHERRDDVGCTARARRALGARRPRPAGLPAGAARRAGRFRLGRVV